MNALIHNCGSHIFLDLTNLYRTAGKIMVDSNGNLYVGNGTLIRARDENTITPMNFFCQSCNRVITIPENLDEIVGVCYECGAKIPVRLLFTVAGYYVCENCTPKYKAHSPKKLDFRSIRIPLT
jgi:hypothetical protein